MADPSSASPPRPTDDQLREWRTFMRGARRSPSITPDYSATIALIDELLELRALRAAVAKWASQRRLRPVMAIDRELLDALEEPDAPS